MEKEEWRASNGVQQRAPHVALVEWTDRDLLQQRLNDSAAIRLFMDPRVQSTIDLVACDPRRGYSLADLAGAACISPSRFRHLFKEETGLTLAQYLKQMKIQAVCEKLLAEPYKTVNQILGEVGVKDESHFFRDFKAAYGLTPLEYRELGLAALFMVIIWERLSEAAKNSQYGQ